MTVKHVINVNTIALAFYVQRCMSLMNKENLVNIIESDILESILLDSILAWLPLLLLVSL